MVILFVRMWVEIATVGSTMSRSVVILFVRMWVEMFYKQLQGEQVPVILFVRMWVEMKRIYRKSAPVWSSSSWGCELKYNSSATRYNGNKSSSSWGCELKLFPWFTGVQEKVSSSSWGCELKCLVSLVLNGQQQSSSSWGCELKCNGYEPENYLDRHPLREDVSWNAKIYKKKFKRPVILFVRMWVEIFVVGCVSL